MAEIDVQIGTDAVNLPSIDQVNQWVDAVLRGERSQAQLAIRFVDEAEGAQLNAAFAGKDYATNVLSFPADVPLGLDFDVLGDIAICAPVVDREAREQGKSNTAHHAHLVVHGVLHLLGMDHQDDTQAQTMEAAEQAILAKLGFADPYASTS
jgi:probable rRNA maturation factor